MRNLLNPKWIFIVNTVPIAVLLFLFYGEFNIIKTFLKADAIQLWKNFGISLLILGLLNFAYAVYLVVKKQELSVWYAVLALFCYIPYLYLYSVYADNILPFNVPQWMVPGNLLLYVGTFLMPVLLYALFVLVVHFTAVTSKQNAGKSILAAIMIPICWYIFSQVILPLWKNVDGDFSIHILLIFGVISTVLFLFFLIRFFYIVASKKASGWQRYHLAWKIPVCILFPLLGLLVNNGQLFDRFRIGGSGVFGDFNSHWFYILAVVNGVLLCLPNLANQYYRLVLLIGRSITFAYTFYFFLVFLPFLPLSIVAIIAFGAGFLMLTPLVLLVVHVNTLSNDVIFLKEHFSKRLIQLVTVAGFLIIPVCITGSYIRDKIVLNETLAYLYNPDYSKPHHINTQSLQQTLAVIRHHKEGSRDILLGAGLPYLSAWYNWLVLDNLTLSDAKINMIEKVFFESTSFKNRSETADVTSDQPTIAGIKTNSVYDSTKGQWLTWVDIDISNKNSNIRTAEFVTTLDLPNGCWISDYYLYVGDKKEMGLLAEKKTAMWVFSEIRNENRDPGILYYLRGNKVAFRVFPFAPNEIRKTGIQFLHKEPVEITIGGNHVKLGNDSTITSTAGFENNDIAYLSSKQKATLKTVLRKPYFHFLVDVSKGKEKLAGDFSKRIGLALKGNAALAANASISFINSNVSTGPVSSNWSSTYRSQKFEGGFYLDRAIRATLVNNYQRQDANYPVMIVVTDSIQHAVLDNNFSDLQMTFPENNLFFTLQQNGKLEPHSLLSVPIVALSDTLTYSFSDTVLEYTSGKTHVYLPRNNQPAIILKNENILVADSLIKEKNWQSALMMQAKWTAQVLHPETSGKEWLPTVKHSFMSKVMTPVTSYIVVENDAQKAILKKKQEEVLSGNIALDLNEDAQKMSEPGLIVMIVLLVVFLWYKDSRKRRLVKPQ